MLKDFIKKATEIVFPPLCTICKALTLEDATICYNCINDLEFSSEDSCEKCSLPFDFEVEGKVECAKCVLEQPKFDKAFYLFAYKTSGKHLIHNFKYYDQLHLAKFFTKLLAKRFHKIIENCDYIIPIPMHKKKLQKRFFNQTSILANYIAKEFKKKVLHDALIKLKNSTPQSELNKNERINNTKNLYLLNDNCRQLINAKKVILIDDVLTTGSTILTCSSKIFQALPSSIHVITIARSL